ncbi:hypothetical protein SUGI_0175760 [Cryptomeria japonica]|nr:hypothetical protein SUGI_0175760 [Cryptomeria japonica]
MSSTPAPVKTSTRRFSLTGRTSTSKDRTTQFHPSKSRKAVNGVAKSNGHVNGDVNGNGSNNGDCSRYLPSRDELQKVFKKFDANNDGQISCSELRGLIASMGQKSSDDEVNVMMKEADTDGDGFINFDEFYEANTKGVNGNRIKKDLESAFQMYDLDKSGNISAEELHKVLKSLGEVSSIQECRQMIKRVDKNADGCISFEEFMTMMSSPHP